MSDTHHYEDTQDLSLPSLGHVSPRSVRAVLTSNPDLDASVICQIVDGLIKTLCICQDRWNIEKQELEARN